jgi:hypothetical protein
MNTFGGLDSEDSIEQPALAGLTERRVGKMLNRRAMTYFN